MTRNLDIQSALTQSGWAWNELSLTQLDIVREYVQCLEKEDHKNTFISLAKSQWHPHEYLLKLIDATWKTGIVFDILPCEKALSLPVELLEEIALLGNDAPSIVYYGGEHSTYEILSIYKVQRLADVPNDVALRVGSTRNTLKEIVLDIVGYSMVKEDLSYDWMDYSDTPDIELYEIYLTYYYDVLRSMNRAELASEYLGYSGNGAVALEVMFGSLDPTVHDALCSVIEEGVEIENMYGLKVAAFKNALDAATEEYGKEPWLPGVVYRLVATFGNNWKAWVKGHTDWHDRCYVLSSKVALDLGDYLIKHKVNNNVDIQTLVSSWSYLSKEEKAIKPKDLLKVCRSKVYSNPLNQQFAEESAKWSISKENYSQYEKRWLASLGTPLPFDTKEYKVYSGLIGKFLHRNDPRGLYLGHYTNCCQHPNGAGAQCAWYGQESPNAGFFVVEKEGEIIAQSFTWVSTIKVDGVEYKAICFDNVEAKGLGNRMESVQDLYEMVAKDLALQLNAKLVTLGTGLGDLKVKSSWHVTTSVSLPSDYTGYTDSYSQVLLYSSNQATPINTKQTRAWVRGLLENDLKDCQAIAQACYQEQWAQQVSLADSVEDTVGYCLVHVDAGIVGYLTADITNKYVCDLAVLPAYRRYTMLLLEKFCLLHPGNWSADLMPDSLKLLRKLDQRGKIALYELGTDDLGRVAVKFTC